MINLQFNSLKYLALAAIAIVGCGGGGSTATGPDATPLSDATTTGGGSFSIEPIPSSDPLSGVFSKRVFVFGIPIVATPNAADAKVLHAATIMAEYLDNNEDGTVDDPPTVAAMQAANALLVMFRDSAELESANLDVVDGYRGQDLQADETNPPGGFDAALEEVLHLIQDTGYATAHPATAPAIGSALALAMDAARGGHFELVPATYPPAAWYHYDDTTCTYDCQATEYFYWGLSSLLGAQRGRCASIANEWEPCTPALLESRDTLLHALLTNPSNVLPTILPDGRYRK